MSQETIEKKLAYLDETKQMIGQALVTKGQTINNETPFRDYVQKVLDIQTGFDTRDATAVASEVLKGKTFYNSQGKVEGTLVPKTGDIKKFETVEEMQNDTTAQEGDLAVVYRSEIQNATVDSQFSSAMFPATVVLPEVITDYVDIMYRPTDSSVMFDCWGSLDSSSFMMSCHTDSGSTIRINYTSSDGITYTRTDTTGNPVDFGTEIYYAYSEMWNDAIGYFIQASKNTFGGLYSYQAYPSSNLVDCVKNIASDGQHELQSINLQPLFDFLTEAIDDNTLLTSDGLSLYTSSYGYRFLAVINSTTSYSLYSVCGTKYGTAISTVYCDLTSGASNEYEWYIRSNSGWGDNGIRVDIDISTKTITSTYITDGAGLVNTSIAAVVPITMQDSSITIHQLVVSGTDGFAINSGFTTVYGYLIAPTQLTLNNANQLLPGKVAYGKNGIYIGTEDIYVNCIPVIAKYNYAIGDNKQYIYQNNTQLYDDGVQKYIYDDSSNIVLNIAKKRTYDVLSGTSSYTYPYITARFITDGINRAYTFDDNYIYYCSQKDTNTIVRKNRNNAEVDIITCSGDSASQTSTADGAAITRFVYQGDIYNVVYSANTSSSSDNSVTFTLQKLDLTNNTVTNIYTKKIAVGTYYSGKTNVKIAKSTYANGKVILAVLRVYANSSSTMYYTAYSVVYDLATGTETVLQNAVTLYSQANASGYSTGLSVNTDGSYVYLTYAIANTYQYKYDINTGKKIYGTTVTKPANYFNGHVFNFLSYTDTYALIANSTYVDANKTRDSQLLKMDLSTGQFTVVYNLAGTSAYTTWYTDIHGNKILFRGITECDVTTEGPVFTAVSNINNIFDGTFVEYIEKGGYKIYEQLSTSLYLTGVSNTDGVCDFYGSFDSSRDLVTPQQIIDKRLEWLLLEKMTYEDTVTPEEYETALDTALDIRDGEVE